MATAEGNGMNQAVIAAFVTSMALTDGRPTRNGSMTIANESVRVAFALARGSLSAAVAIADGIGLDIGVHENDDLYIVGRTREVRIIEGHEWRQLIAKAVGGHSRETLFTREELTRLKFAVELIEQLESEGNGA